MIRHGVFRGALAALTALVSGCDDGTVITRVRDLGLSRSYIAIAARDGMPVEVHGAPFEGVTVGEVVARLAFPAGSLYGFGFRAVPVGSGEINRLVLVFNRVGAPDGRGDCRRTKPAATRPPAAQGFDVTATFCMGERALGTGHMEARKTRADDPEGFAKAMRRLMRAITQVNGQLK